ncbi:hypothetical protein E2C01_100464 [Portunus trituberculatus]|uniref:Uncharacterized protein n=1 Tax=Portunus trituberculatus TaxID=210409 RepID=A0A5B7KHM3_PORTR|nr:hypothetical protein [Portunus trituberculatus]
MVRGGCCKRHSNRIRKVGRVWVVKRAHFYQQRIKPQSPPARQPYLPAFVPSAHLKMIAGLSKCGFSAGNGKVGFCRRR